MKKSYDSKFKSRVALEALRVDLTVAECVQPKGLGANFTVHAIFQRSNIGE